MKKRSKIIALLITVIILSSIVFTLFACNKKANDPFANLKESANNALDEKPADDSKSLKSTEVTPFSAFQDLMTAVNKTSGDVVRNFNNILRSEIETEIINKKRESVINPSTGKEEFVEKEEIYVVRTRAYLNFKDTKNDKNEVLLEVLKREPGSQDKVKLGLYYKEGVLIFKNNSEGKVSNPLWIKDIDLNKIFTFASRYGVNTFFKNIVNSIISNNLKVTVGGNTIPIMELIGPIIFPVIFSTDVNVLTNENDKKIPDGVKRYVLTFNSQKFVKAMTPVLSRIPKLVESLVDKEEVKNLESLVNTLLGKFETKDGEGVLTIEGLKNYNINLFRRKMVFDIGKSGKLLSISLNKETPKIRTNQNQNEIVNVKEITTKEGNSFTDETNVGPEGNFDYPEDVLSAIENAKGAQPSVEQFSFGKANINLDLTLESKEKREITLNKILLNDDDDASQVIEKIRASENDFKRKLGLSEDQFNNDKVNQAVENRYRQLKKEYSTRQEKLFTDLENETKEEEKEKIQKEINKLIEEVKSINKMYSDYKTSELIATIISELGDRKFTIQEGKHGIHLSLKTDINFNKIHESRISIELSDANKNTLIGIYLVPYNEAEKLSAVVIDMKNIGLPTIKYDGINLYNLVYEPLVGKVTDVFTKMSSKGFINFIMELVNQIKEKKIKGQSENNSENTLKKVRLTYNEEKSLYALEEIQNENNSNEIVKIIENIISDSGLIGEDKRTVQILVKKENIKKLGAFINNKLSEKGNKKNEVVGKLVNNLLNNLLYDLSIEAGYTTQDSKPSKSYSDYQGSLKLKLNFLNDDLNEQTRENTKTKMEVGLGRSSLFYELPKEFYEKTTEIKNNLSSISSIFDTKSITLKGDIKLALESSSDENKDIIEFIKNLNPEFEEKLKKFEKEYSNNFGFDDDALKYDISAEIKKGLTFALRIDFEANINISALKLAGIDENSMKNINSIAALRLLYGKYKLENMLKSVYMKANVYTATNINDIKDDEGKWKPDAIWNHFAEVVYSSEEKMEGTSQKGGLFVKFVSNQLPNICFALDLKTIILEKGKGTFVVPDPKQLIKPKTNDNNNENKPNKKPNLDVKNLLFGIVGGVDLYAQQIVVNLANTTISTILNQIFPNNKLLNDATNSSQAIPTAKISALLKYSNSGISLDVIISKLKLNGNLTEDDNDGKGGINVSFGLGNLSLKTSSTENTISIEDRDTYLGVDSIKEKINDITSGAINKDVYVGINTEIDLALTSNAKNYSENFAEFLSYINKKLDELLEKENLNSVEKNIVKQLKQLQISLSVLNKDGKDLYTGLKVKVAGRIDIAKLLSSIKKLQNKTATKDEVIDAAKSLVESLNVVLAVSLHYIEGSESPDRLLTIYVDGAKRDIYIRFLTTAQPSIQASQDTKIKINLDEIWNVIAGLFLIDESKFKIDNFTNVNSINTLESQVIKQLSKELVDEIKDSIISKLDEIKNLLTQKSTIFGMLSKIAISKEGIGLQTSDTILKAIVKKLGFNNIESLPSVQIGAKAKVFDESGNIGGLEASVKIATKEEENGETIYKDILGIKIGIPKINFGILLSNNNELKQKLTPEKFLGNELYSNIVLGSDLSAYTNIKDIKDFKISTSITIDAIAKTEEALKEFLVNLGLSEKISSITNISPDQSFKINLRVALPLSEIYKIIVDTYNQDEYSYEIISKNKAKNEEVKKYILNESLRHIFTNSKLLVKLDIINKITKEEKANVLTLYYEGQNVGNCILFNSKMLGLEKPIKIEGAPEKITPIILSSITKNNNTSSNEIESGYLTNDTQFNFLNVVKNLINSKTIDKLDVSHLASIMLEPDLLKIELSSGIISLILDIAGVQLNDVQIERLLSKAAITTRNNTETRTLEIGARINVAGLKKKVNNEYQVTDTFELGVILTEFFISADADDKISIFDSSQAQIINVNSTDSQYLSLKFALELGEAEDSNGLNNFYLTPSLSLLKEMILNTPGIEEKVSRDDLNNIFKGLDKLLKVTEQNINLKKSKYTAEFNFKIDIKDFINYLQERNDNEIELIKKYQGNINNIPKTQLDISRLKANLKMTYLYFDMNLKQDDVSVFRLGYDSSDKVNNLGKPIAFMQAPTIANNDVVFLKLNELDLPKIISRSIKMSNLNKINDLKNGGSESVIINEENKSNSISTDNAVKLINSIFENIAKIDFTSRIDKPGTNKYNVSIASNYVNLVNILSSLTEIFAQLEYIKQVENFLNDYYDNNTDGIQDKVASKDDILPKTKLGFDLNVLPLALKLNLGIEQKISNDITPKFSVDLGLKDLNLKVDTLNNVRYKDINDVFVEFNTELSFEMKTENIEKLMQLALKNEKYKNYLDEITIKFILENLKEGKNIDVSIQSYINLGDIFLENVTNNRSRIQFKFKASALGEKPIVIKTDLRNFYVDLSALNLPKFKFQTDIISIFKNLINVQIAKKEEEVKKKEKDLENNINNIQNTQQTNNNKKNNKLKLNPINILSTVIGSIERSQFLIEKDQNNEYDKLVGYKLEFNTNFIDDLLKNVLNVTLKDPSVENSTLFDNLSLEIKDFKKDGAKLQIGTIKLDFKKIISEDKEFNINAQIGKNIKTLFGLTYSENELLPDGYNSDISEFKKLNDTAITVRTKAFIKVKSNGEPFLSLVEPLKFLLNKLDKKVNRTGFSDELNNKLNEYLTAHKQIEKHTGIYSYTESGQEFGYNIFLNIDLPLYELFETSTSQSEFRIQLKVVDDENSVLINAIYSQQKQSVTIDSKVLGINGFEISGIDILGLIKKAPNADKILNSLIASNNRNGNLGAKELRDIIGTLEDSTVSDNYNFEIKYTNDEFGLTIKKSFIEKVKGAIIRDQELIKNNNDSSQAEKEKAENTISLIKAIPDISDIKLEYINNKEDQSNNKAALTLSIQHTLNENLDSEMTLSVGIDLSEDVFKSYDKQGFALRENAIQDEIETSSTISIKDIKRIKEGANFLENFPIKQLDAQFDGHVNIRVDGDTYNDGPLGKVFKLIDKLLLKKTPEESKSGFVIPPGESKDYKLEVKGRVVTNIRDVNSFINNTGINLKVLLNNEEIASISYLASENAIFLDLTKLGLMKVKIYGFNLLSLVGTTLFPSDSNFNTVIADASSNNDKSVLALNYRDIIALSDNIIEDASRVEVGFNIQKSTKEYDGNLVNGVLGNISLKINDIFIKNLIEIIVNKQIRELMANDSQYFMEHGGVFSSIVDEEINKKKDLLDIIREFSFNDILVRLSLFSNPPKGYTGLSDLSININLDKKRGAGNIYKGNIYKDGDIFDNYEEKSYAKILINEIKLNEYKENISIGEIQNIINDTNDSPYSGLAIGDITSLLFGSNKAQLVPLISNVIEALIQDASKDNILKGQIDVRTPLYTDTQKLELNVKRNNQTVKEEKSPLKIDIKGTTKDGTFEVVANLALNHTYLKMEDAPEALGALKPLIKSILNNRDIGSVIKNALEKLKNTSDEGGGSGTGETEEWIYTEYSQENNNLNKFWSEWYALKGFYNYHVSKIITEDQLELLQKTNGNFARHTLWCSTFDENMNPLSDSKWLDDLGLYNNITGENLFRKLREKDSKVYYCSIRIYNDGAKDHTKIKLKKRNYTFKDVLEPIDGKISSLIDSIQIVGKPVIRPINGSDYPIYSPSNPSTSIKINLQKEKTAQILANLSSFISNSVGRVSQADHEYFVNYQNHNDSEYLQKSLDILGNALTGLVVVQQKEAWTMGFNLIKKTVKELITAVWPISYPGWIKSNGQAYLELLLESRLNNLISRVQIKLAKENNAHGWELLLNNNGIRLATVLEADKISLGSDFNFNLNDAYDGKSYQEAYADLLSRLPKQTNVNFKESNIQNKSISLSWVNSGKLIDPTVSTEENENNFIELLPYAMNKKVEYNDSYSVKIKLSKNGVRKPHKIFAKIKKEGVNDFVWEELNVSILQNIKPGNATEIRKYLSSIQELAIQMKDGNDNLVDSAPFEIDVNGSTFKVYKFGYKDQKGKKVGFFKFDTSNLPETIEDINELQESNKFINLSYSLGLTKTVSYRIAFTVENVILNQQDLIKQIQEEISQLTKNYDNSQITNDPSMWSYNIPSKLMGKEYDIKFMPDNYNTDPNKTYKFIGKIVLPYDVTVQDLIMNYDGTKPEVIGVKKDDLGQEIPGKEFVLTTFYPQYKPQRINMSDIVVNITAVLPDKTKVSIGSIKLSEIAKIDLYPPYSISTISGRESKTTKNSLAPSIAQSNVDYTFDIKPLEESSVKKELKIKFDIKNKKLNEILGQEFNNLTFIDYNYFVKKLAGDDYENLISFITEIDSEDIKEKTLQEKKETIIQKLTEFGYSGTYDDFVQAVYNNINFYNILDEQQNNDYVIMKKSKESENKIEVVRFIPRGKSKLYFTIDNFDLGENIEVKCDNQEDKDNSENNIEKGKISLSYQNEEATKQMLKEEVIDSLFYKKIEDTNIQEKLLQNILINGKNKDEFSNVVKPLGYDENSSTYTLFDLESNILTTQLQAFNSLGKTPLFIQNDINNAIRFMSVNPDITYKYMIRFSFKLYDVEFEIKINIAELEGINDESDETIIKEKINKSILLTKIGTNTLQKKSYMPKVEIDQYGKIKVEKADLEFEDTLETLVLNKSLYGENKKIGYFYGPYDNANLNTLTEKYLNEKIRYVEINDIVIDTLVVYLKKIGNKTFDDLLSIEEFYNDFETAKEKYLNKQNEINKILSTNLNAGNINQLSKISLVCDFSGETIEHLDKNDLHFIKSGKNILKLKATILKPTQILNDKSVNVSKIDEKIKAVANVGKLDVGLKLTANSSYTKKDLIAEYESNDLNFNVEIINKNIKEFKFEFTFFTDLIKPNLDELNNYKIGEYELQTFKVYRKDEDLTDNFNISIENFKDTEGSSIITEENKNQLKFIIGKKHIKAVLYDKKFVINYLDNKVKDVNVKLSKENSFIDIDVQLKYKNENDILTKKLSLLEPAEKYNVEIDYLLKLKEAFKNIVDDEESFINNHYKLQMFIEKDGREISAEDFQDSFELKVNKLKIKINYKYITREYSGETLTLDELFEVYSFDDILLTEEFIKKEFIDKDPKSESNPTDINFKLVVDKITQEVLYQQDMDGKRYIDIFRIPTLGAGQHTFSIDFDNKNSKYFELIDNKDKSSVITITKKKLEFRIGKAIKYYNQEIDTDTIPLLDKSVTNIMDIDCFEELSIPKYLGYDPKNKEKPLKFGEKPAPYSKLFQGFVKWDEYVYNSKTNIIDKVKKTNTISDLSMQFNWVEGVGIQNIYLAAYESPNYYIDIEEINKNPGIMEIKKTKIKINFPEKFKKYYGDVDPLISLAGMVYQNPALEAANDEEYVYLQYNGIYEVSVSNSEFIGSLKRAKGEKKGEYRYDIGDLRLAHPENYELEFVDNNGKAVEFKDNKNAALLIEQKPKTIPKGTAKGLIIFFLIVEISMIIVAIVILQIAKKYKKQRKLNDWRTKNEKE